MTKALKMLLLRPSRRSPALLCPCRPSAAVTEQTFLTAATVQTRLSSGPHTPPHLDDESVWACGLEPGGVEELFYVAVWEVREIIDCYNWCPLISWQHR